MHQCDDLKRDGFSVVNSFLNQRHVVTLCNEINALVPGEGVSLRNGRVFGARNLLQQLPSLRSILRPDFPGSCELGGLIGNQARPVRCIFFDKNPSANWTVVWHQDLTIAVRRKREVDGFKLWTTKAGVHHVQPPVSILENMLSLRIHLDLADEFNGALRVIPGSHRLGRLSPSLIKHLTATQAPRICHVNAGGALFMKPLLLHSSLSCRNPVHRRVLHIEFSAERLPGGLEWYGH
jgi:hypothetical protein